MSVYLSGFINHLFYAWFLHFTVFSVTPIRVLFNRRKNWGRRNFRMLSFYNRITQKDIIFTNLKLPSWRSLMRLSRIPGECCNVKQQTKPLYEKHRLWLEQNCPNHIRCLKTAWNRDRLQLPCLKNKCYCDTINPPFIYVFFIRKTKSTTREFDPKMLCFLCKPGLKKMPTFPRAPSAQKRKGSGAYLAPDSCLSPETEKCNI